MKIILLGLVLLVAWKAGLVLLAAVCLGALWVTRNGIQEIKDGKIRGESKIVLGMWAGGATLLTALVKLTFVLLAWVSLSMVFPGLVPWIKSMLTWLGSL